MRRVWQRGEMIEAAVVEVIDATDLIVRLGGGPDEPESKLLRVSNQTHQHLTVGNTVRLRVTEIHPLKFQYVEASSEQRRQGRIDISV